MCMPLPLSEEFDWSHKFVSLGGIQLFNYRKSIKLGRPQTEILTSNQQSLSLAMPTRLAAVSASNDYSNNNKSHILP
jgi:hypothetical protein